MVASTRGRGELEGLRSRGCPLAPSSGLPPAPHMPKPLPLEMLSENTGPEPPSLFPSGLGPVAWCLPDPGLQGALVLPSAPCCPMFAAALLCVCFCQEGSGHLPHQGRPSPRSQVSGGMEPGATQSRLFRVEE